MSIDRLALSRAQHREFRHQIETNDDDEEKIDAISDWSESDRECCPLSDVELFSNPDGTTTDLPYDDDFEDDKLPRMNTFLEQILNFPPTTNESMNSTRLSFENELEKKKNVRPSIVTPSKKTSTAPLLPARRVSSKPSTVILPSRNRQTTTTMTRSFVRRDHSSRKDSTYSMNSSSSPSQEELHRGPTASPNFSQTSNNHLVPRVYELKKFFVDDTDYGRLTDVATMKSIPARNRQKWGTIVHPPFPLGYQQVSSEHVHHVVERLTSPLRSRDRRTPSQTPSKRYLSVEETEALVSIHFSSFLNFNSSSTDKSINQNKTNSIVRSLLSCSTIIETSEKSSNNAQNESTMEKCRCFSIKRKKKKPMLMETFLFLFSFL